MAMHDYEIIDDRFYFCVSTNARVDKLYDGCTWAEGPVYFPGHRSLIWSDIPNNRMLRWDEVTGAVGVFRADSQYTNGNTIDRKGRLISCQQGGRNVVRTEHDGSCTIIADRFRGRRFNSPNDVVVKSDGSIWFTDPGYGIDSNFEGIKGVSEIGADNVYRVDPATRDIAVVAEDFRRPNGLAFSPDEKTLYIVDSGGMRFPDNRRHIRTFNVETNNELTGGAVFAECGSGKFDGIRLDDAGRIWAAAGDGVHCYEHDGTLIGKILLPEAASNLVFGGPKNNRLFITATTSVYTVLLAVDGASLPWMRSSVSERSEFARDC